MKSSESFNFHDMPQIAVLKPMLVERHGQIFADIADLLAQHLILIAVKEVADERMPGMCTNKMMMEALGGSVKWFSARMEENLNIPEGSIKEAVTELADAVMMDMLGPGAKK